MILYIFFSHLAFQCNCLLLDKGTHLPESEWNLHAAKWQCLGDNGKKTLSSFSNLLYLQTVLEYRVGRLPCHSFTYGGLPLLHFFCTERWKKTSQYLFLFNKSKIKNLRQKFRNWLWHFRSFCPIVFINISSFLLF